MNNIKVRVVNEEQWIYVMNWAEKIGCVWYNSLEKPSQQSFWEKWTIIVINVDENTLAVGKEENKDKFYKPYMSFKEFSLLKKKNGKKI